MALKCKLVCQSTSPHVAQLYTGFDMLASDGLIEVSQEVRRGAGERGNGVQYLRTAQLAHLAVELHAGTGEKALLHFDNHDSMEIAAEDLEGCDCYFKRSYSAAYIDASHAARKDRIHPLGLNYLVLPNARSALALRRHLALGTSWREKLFGAIAAFDRGNWLRFHPRLRHLHAAPSSALEPGVLFMATAYDPHDVPDRPPEKVEERIRHNEFRAECIRLLRKEFGQRFLGGFDHSPYTLRHHRDVLLADPLAARKENYLELLRGFPIGVATTGLHGSNGWKLAEYVAFSKAIVSEKLHYENPGEFRPGRNYLEFSSPTDCVAQCATLMTDRTQRERMMFDNFRYYQQYARPDMLVMNAIVTAMSRSDRLERFS